MNIILQVNTPNRNRTPPDYLICSITGELFVDPVTTTLGYTYSREAIETWFQTHDTDPLVNECVASKSLVPNRAIRAAVQAYSNTEH